MKTLKRILLILGILLVLFVGFLIAAPIIFKDQIVDNVKTSINKAVNAEVDFADIDVSFLSSFPDINLTVEDFEVIGVDTFAGLPLARGEEASVDLGFWSVVAGDASYKIDAVDLERPYINLRVINADLANYLIVDESGADAGAGETTEGGTRVALESFSVDDGHFIYDDRTTETYLEMTGLDVAGNGDFTADIFDLFVDAKANQLTLAQGGITYLDKVTAVTEGVINVDLPNFRYTFTNVDVLLNELALLFSGSIDLEDNDDILFDIDYRAPANDFRQLWSIVPAVYTEGYDQVQTGGTFTLEGTVDGAFNSANETYPAFTVRSVIDNGSVKYPGRPVGLNDIAAELDVNSPTSDLNDLVVSLPKLNFNLGGDPFRSNLRLANLLRDPNIDGRIRGTLDLGKWAQAIPLEGVTELAGRIVADVTMNGVRQSLIDAGRYAEVDLAGDVRASNIVYVTDELPAVRVAQATAAFTPQALAIEEFNATLGRSDLSASGTINNFLAYFSPEQTLRGDLRLRSNFFDADEWITDEAPAAASPAEVAAAEATAGTETEIFDRFDFRVDAEIDELRYAEYRPEEIKVVGNIKPNRLDIGTASARLEESTFAGSGYLANLFDYTFDDGVLTGDLSLRSGYLDLDDFVSDAAVETTPVPSRSTAGPETQTESTAAIPIPKNIKVNVDMIADRVKYTDVILDDLRGQLAILDGEAVINNGSATLFGGRMDFEGAYDTAEEGDPGFRFHYNLNGLDFSQTFNTLNSFAALAPVGKFLRGRFNSELVMEGKLGQDLFPKLNTIDATGLLRTSEAQLAGFQPLQKIGQQLDIKELRNSTTLKDLIAAFTVKDGQVTVEPFDVIIGGLAMTVGGTHGLNTDMNYNISSLIPRDRIERNALAGTALNALDKLGGQASKLGLNITPGDTLNVGIKLTGTIASPQIAFDLLGSRGGGQTVRDAAEEAIRDRVDAEIDNRKKEAKERVDVVRQEVTDSVRTVVEERTDALKEEAKDRVAGALGGIVDSTAIDSLNLPPAARETVDKVKDKLENFNPFKRRKKPAGGS